MQYLMTYGQVFAEGKTKAGFKMGFLFADQETHGYDLPGQRNEPAGWAMCRQNLHIAAISMS